MLLVILTYWGEEVGEVLLFKSYKYNVQAATCSKLSMDYYLGWFQWRRQPRWPFALSFRRRWSWWPTLRPNLTITNVTSYTTIIIDQTAACRKVQGDTVFKRAVVHGIDEVSLLQLILHIQRYRCFNPSLMSEQQPLLYIGPITLHLCEVSLFLLKHILLLV